MINKGGLFIKTIKEYTNEELVTLYRQKYPGAIDELVRRFTHSSRKEAGALLKEHRNNTTAEFEDLVQIGVGCSLMTALESYNFMGGFFSFWILIARHDMLEHIKLFSLTYAVGETIIGRREAYDDIYDYIIASSENVAKSVNNKIFANSIIELLKSVHDKRVKDIDKQMFIDYYFGELSIMEMVEKYHTKYHTIRTRINRVLEVVKNILFK